MSAHFWDVAPAVPTPAAPAAVPTAIATDADSALYGQDISTFKLNYAGVPDLDPLGLPISGRRAMVERFLRRLSTPHGGLQWDQTPGAEPLIVDGIPYDDPDFGFPLRQYVNANLSENDLGAIAGRIQGEGMKDEEIATVSCDLTLTTEGDETAMLVAATITPADPGDKPFLLVFTQTQFALKVLSPAGVV